MYFNSVAAAIMLCSGHVMLLVASTSILGTNQESIPVSAEFLSFISNVTAYNRFATPNQYDKTSRF
jgi:hypothetical protein